MPVAVTPSNPTTESGLAQFNVTIASSGVAQPLSLTTIACSEYLLQVTFGGASIRIGGPTVTTATGVQLLPPTAATDTPDSFGDYIDDLKKVYIIGTAATVVSVTYRTI
jgi:hypothetical protein